MASRRARKTGRGDRLRVAVLMGGPSSEHEVSLAGGQNVVAGARSRALRRAARRHLTRRRLACPPRAPGRARRRPTSIRTGSTAGSALRRHPRRRSWRSRVAGGRVFPCLHGRFGEDGTMQACLDGGRDRLRGQRERRERHRHATRCAPRRSSRTTASATPPLRGARRGRPAARAVADRPRSSWPTHGTPLVLKDPLRRVSSLEVQIADDARRGRRRRIEELVPPARRGCMVEAYVPGRELTAGVLHDRERGAPVALPIVEIRPRAGRSFDYHEKYASGRRRGALPGPDPAGGRGGGARRSGWPCTASWARGTDPDRPASSTPRACSTSSR